MAKRRHDQLQFASFRISDCGELAPLFGLPASAESKNQKAVPGHRSPKSESDQREPNAMCTRSNGGIAFRLRQPKTLLSLGVPQSYVGAESRPLGPDRVMPDGKAMFASSAIPDSAKPKSVSNGERSTVRCPMMTVQHRAP